MTFLAFLKEYDNGFGKSPRALASRSKEDEMEIAKQSSINKKLMYKGWTFNPSIHASAQAHDRRPDFSLDDWKKLHLKTYEKVDKIAQNTAKSGYYLFFSKSLDQGYVSYVDFSHQEVKIVTVLPKGRNKAKDDTRFVMMEGVQTEIVIEEEIELDDEIQIDEASIASMASGAEYIDAACLRVKDLVAHNHHTEALKVTAETIGATKYAKTLQCCIDICKAEGCCPPSIKSYCDSVCKELKRIGNMKFGDDYDKLHACL